MNGGSSGRGARGIAYSAACRSCVAGRLLRNSCTDPLIRGDFFSTHRIHLGEECTRCCDGLWDFDLVYVAC